jgi:hypothetical protein
LAFVDLVAQVQRPFFKKLVPSERQLEVAPIRPESAAAIERNNHLVRYAKVVTSQDGEDGVIGEIMRRLDISKGWCVEFGAYDGKTDANVWNLIHNHGWKGVLIEPFDKAYKTLLETYAGVPDIHFFNEGVGWEGDSRLDAIFARTPLPIDFDFMVVDIDGNDFYVWRACTVYRPKVVMIEFNPFIAPDIHFVKAAELDERASSSLRAVYELAKSKDYEMVAVVGGNAIFVRKEYFPLFEVADNRPASMFKERWETKIFQGYDGTLMLAGNRNLVWKHQLDRNGKMGHVQMADEDIQVLPIGLRVFRPRLSYRNTFLEEWAGKLDRARVPSNELLAYQSNVTSECGEDGILAQLFERVGVTKGYCVEAGAFDGVRFSNTRSLLGDCGWRGLLVEKDEAAYSKLHALYETDPAVSTVKAEVTTKAGADLDTLLRNASAPKNLDFLCIDIEGNDYHIWASLRGYRPKVVMVDINPTVPNDVLFAQEDSSTINHGASLRAFVQLGKLKGYELAAATTWNAIFVRNDLFPLVRVHDNDIDKMYYPVFEMKIFHSINCFVTTQGCDRLVWHNHIFDPESLQPLSPKVRAMPFTTENLGEHISTFFDPRAGQPSR